MAPTEDAANRGGSAREIGSDALDGRRARKARNRAAVIDAMLDAIESGNTNPSVQTVAEDSGVSERSVFRYFSDLDELLIAAFERALERYEQYRVIERQGVGSLPERVEALITQRIRFWMHAGAAAHAARVRAARFTGLAEGLRESRIRMRAQLEDHFRAELAPLPEPRAATIVHLLEVLLSNDAFRLFVEDGLSAADVRRRWRHGILALLAPGIDDAELALGEIDLVDDR